MSVAACWRVVDLDDVLRHLIITVTVLRHSIVPYRELGQTAPAPADGHCPTCNKSTTVRELNRRMKMAVESLGTMMPSLFESYFLYCDFLNILNIISTFFLLSCPKVTWKFS